MQLFFYALNMFKFYNPNPCGKMVGDCVIRGISKVLDQSWSKTYMDISWQGYLMCDMPSSNVVWATYLDQKGFVKEKSKYTTVQGFCEEHPKGVFLLATGSHVIAVIDGDYYDAWDSGKEIVSDYFERRIFYE